MFQLRPLPRTLTAALRDVGDPKVSVRKSAISDLTRLAQHDDDRAAAVVALVERLEKDEAAEIRSAAALALADVQARGELDSLLTSADDAHAVVRQMVVLALGELAPRGHREVREVVERALGDSEGALRFQALLAASKLFADELDECLERAIVDSDDRVRYLALRLLDERLADSQRGIAELSSVLRRRCLGALEDDKLEVRVAAAIVAARDGDDTARQVLVEGLNRGVTLPAPEDEQELIELAGELGLKAAEPGLMRHAWGRFGLLPGRFAFQAKVALARLGNAKAARDIIRGLSSWDRDTRTLSVVAAGRAGLKQAKERLEQMCKDSTVDPSVVRTALREIG